MLLDGASSQPDAPSAFFCRSRLAQRPLPAHSNRISLKYLLMYSNLCAMMPWLCSGTIFPCRFTSLLFPAITPQALLREIPSQPGPSFSNFAVLVQFPIPAPSVICAGFTELRTAQFFSYLLFPLVFTRCTAKRGGGGTPRSPLTTFATLSRALAVQWGDRFP